MAAIKILIADDHELFRRSLRSLIEDRSDWRVCGEAVDGREAVTKARELRPDLILMDVSMPEMNGLEASRRIREHAPDANILIVSQNDPAQMEKAARKVGARGFVPKSRISQELVPAVDRITKNEGTKPAGGPNRGLRFANVRGTQLLANDTRERYRQKIARITLDSMVQFVGLLDAQGTVLEINQVALDAVGIKLSDVEGKPFWTTFWWQVSDEINATLRDSIRRAAEGEFVRWDTQIYGRASGKETIIIDASLMPVKDEFGNVVFITAEGRDITEKKAHEREIARQREELAKLDELKTQFFANISHEFRTPLTLMMGPLEDAIAQPEGLSAVNRERITLAHRNSLRLLKLVNSLLDFSRIEAGRIQSCYEPTDLATFTAELASVFRSAIERAGLRFSVDCAPIADPVYIDREMWEKIVFNLLSNAFKFTFEGEIEVVLHAVGGSVELSVRDTGTGIPEQDLPHLLERFYRVKNAQGRTFEGSGIGLALVQELVKLHGGVVRVETQPGRGSKFRVTIPQGKEHLPADRIGAERSSASTALRGDVYVQEALRWVSDDHRAAEFPVEPLTSSETLPRAPEQPESKRSFILLAEDNADMRDYVRRLLGNQYEVEAVADGQEALTRARQRRPDLILSDVMMPRMDGFALLQAVRAEQLLKHVPFILLSARAGEESRIEGLASGADDYLVKPFSARELLARVNSHLAIAKVRGEAAHMERQLRRDAEMLAAIVSSSDDAIISQNLEGAIITWNKGAERIFGYTAEQVVGGNIELIVPAERRNEHREFLDRVRRGERVDHFQTVRLRKDGMPLDISAGISPLRDSADQVVGASIVARDISRQKRNEQDVRASEERFRAIVETTPECVKLVALDGTLLHMNTSGLRMVGARSPEAVLGKNIYSLIAPEHRDQFRAFNESVCRGVRGSLEFDIIGLEGNRRHMETHAAPLLGPDGSVAQLAVARDITERKQAEETLRRQKERFDLVANATEVGFWFCDLPFDKLTWDNRVKEHFWLAPDAEVTIHTFYECLHPDDREPTRQAIARSNESDLPYDIEYRTVAPDGREKWIRAMGRTFYDEAGNPRRFDGVTLDITNLKHAEESHRKLAETLEQEVRTRTRQLEERTADVVRQAEQLRDLSRRVLQAQDEERRHIARELHDSAGQTLTVLGMNLAQLAQKAGRKAPELAGDAEIIQETVQQLHREIRTTSYLLHPPLLDESGLYSALSWYVQGLSERSGLEITLEMSDKFGRLHRDMELIVFRLVQECLTNIHRHSGSKTAVIRIARSADAVDVEVQDHGKGMSMERLAEIQSKGSGVGILGMRERLRQFEGSLNVESGPKGTRILANIPIPNPSTVEPEGIEPLPTIQ